jgi:hypothetical protein
MFEKIGRLAETAATNVSQSRRGFLGQFGRAALVAAGAVGVVLALPGRGAAARFHHCRCDKPYYSCAPTDYLCQAYCGSYCA